MQHLAAGHSNVQERNSDFHTIEAGLRFLRGKTLKSHECVLSFLPSAPLPGRLIARFSAAA